MEITPVSDAQSPTVGAVTFKSFIHLEIIFVVGVRSGFNVVIP